MATIGVASTTSAIAAAAIAATENNNDKKEETRTTATTRTFRCECNKFQLKLFGDPILNSTCHCNSCVSCARFIDSGGRGTSAIDNHGGGGVALSMFQPWQVDFDSMKPKLTTEMTLGSVKVGQEGKLQRLYSKCCNTMIGFVHSKFVALNRNAIYEVDAYGSDTKKQYVPTDPPHHVHTKNSFNDSTLTIPEPKYDTIPIKLYWKLFPYMINPFGSHLKEKDYPMLFPNLDNAEIVEITW